MATRADIVHTARQYLNVPFHHQGRSRFGLDCAGLILCVAKELDLLPPNCDYRDYQREPDGDRLLQAIEQWCSPADPWYPGDVLVFRIKINPRHVAIATHIEPLNAMGMIHTYKNTAVAEHVLDEWWKSRIVAAYSLPGIEE